MLVRLRRVLAQTTRAAHALEVSVQSPHLHVIAKNAAPSLIRLTSSCWIFRLHFVTPFSRLLDASVEGGVEDTMLFVPCCQRLL
jgi:hypothetical protein